MRFEVCVDRKLADRSAAGITDAVERFAERDAVDIALGEKIVEREDAREGARSAHRGNESRAFLVGPDGDADRLRGHDAGIVERA